MPSFDKLKKNKFLTGAAILAVAGVICRLIGVVIRIPLTNIVGNYGMGIYQMVFPLYALLLIISSAGVPVAISKMVAKHKVDNNMSECRKILVNAIILLGAIGLVMSALFMIFAYPISMLQGHRDAWIIYIAIAPSVFLVCVIAAFRGYFQGLQNMVPTATSQIIEQTVKLVFALTLAAILIKQSVVWAVFGAILAVTISETIAAMFLIIIYIFHKKKHPSKKEVKSEKTKLLSKKLIIEIVKTSIPITLMASVFPLILVIDSLFIIKFLTISGTSHEESTQLFGISSGVVHTLINMPALLGAAIATAIVPCIATLLKEKKHKELNRKTKQAILIAIAVSAVFIIIYMIFAQGIIELLYRNAFKDNSSHLKVATRLMRIETSLIFLVCITAVMSAVMQGLNKSKLPLIAISIGGGAKLIFQFIFIFTPLGIYAVSIGNVICFSIATIINAVNLFALLRKKD